LPDKQAAALVSIEATLPGGPAFIPGPMEALPQLAQLAGALKKWSVWA